MFAPVQDDHAGHDRSAGDAAGQNTAGWHPDPFGEYDLRYHNGVRWTGDVSRDGERFVAPAPLTSGIDPAPTNQRIGTVALTAGVVALTISWVPFVCVIGTVLAIVAIVAGVKGRRIPRASGSATAGIVTGAAALLISVGGIWLSVVLVQAVARFEDPGAHQVSLDECVEVDGVTRASGTITNDESGDRSYVVTVEFVPGRTGEVEVDDLAPQESRAFVLEEDLRFDELDCSVTKVTGPHPFGIDLDE